MKLSISPWRATFTFSLLLATSTIGLAWISTPKQPAGEPLKAAMHQLEDSLKILGKGVTSENRVASLEELAKFQAAVLIAKALTPDSAAKVEEKKRAAFENEFRATLVEALQFTCSAELAILDGKYKDADTLIRNKLAGVKSKGHGKYKTDGGQ